MLNKYTRLSVFAGILLASSLAAAPLVATAAPAASVADSKFEEVNPSAPVQSGNPRLATAPAEGNGDDTVAAPLPKGAKELDPTVDRTLATAKLQKIYVWVMSSTATTTDDLPASEFTRAAITSTVTKMDAYWSAESGGAISTSLATEAEDGGIQFRTYTTPKASCDWESVVKDVTDAAFGGIFKDNASVGKNRHLLILSTEGWVYQKQGKCGRAWGLTPSPGYAGGWMFTPRGAGADGLSTILHEYGHNMSFRHANAAICKNTASLDGPLSAFQLVKVTGSAVDKPNVACPTEEYGDFLDVMGNANTETPHISSPQLITLGYMKSPDYKDVKYTTASTTVQLKPLNGAGPNRAIRILDPKSNSYYYIEYRTAQGVDAASTEFTGATYKAGPYGGYQSWSRDSDPAVGVVRVLRGLPFATGQGSSLLATGTVAGQPANIRHTHLNPGQVFKNHNNGFRLTLKSVSPSAGASIKIDFVGDPTSAAIALSGTSQLYGSPNRVTATATVAKLANVYPAGKMLFYDQGRYLGSAATNSVGQGALLLPSSIPGGKRHISVIFDPTDPWQRNSVPAVADLTVKKTTSSASITLRASSVKKKKKLGATVIVKAPDVKGPSGSVSVYAGTKKLKTYSLSASKNGKLSITLPKMKKKGSFAITVRYSGSTSIYASRSLAKPLRVK